MIDAINIKANSLKGSQLNVINKKVIKVFKEKHI